MDLPDIEPGQASPDDEPAPKFDSLISEIYYHAESRLYYRKNSRGQFKPGIKSDITDHFRATLTDMDDKKRRFLIAMLLDEIRETQDVEAVGSIPGQFPGLHTDKLGRRILVTEGPRLIEPKEGQWPTIRAILLGTLGYKQFVVLLTFLQQSLRTLHIRQWQPAPALVMVGPKNSNKSLILTQIITPLLGGRSAHAYGYLSGATDFNGDLAKAEVLTVDDEIYRTDSISRMKLGATIKSLTTSGYEVRIHQKGREAFTVTPFWRVILALNDEDDCLQMLPPIEGSNRDKYIILGCTPASLPMPASTAEEKAELRAKLTEEYPAFIYYLLTQFRPGKRYTAGRFGVMPFQNQCITRRLRQLSPEETLLQIIEANWPSLYFSKSKSDTDWQWTGTAEGLRGKLQSAEFDGSHRADLQMFPGQKLGIYLGKLCDRYPKNFTVLGKFHNSNRYGISLPVNEGSAN